MSIRPSAFWYLSSVGEGEYCLRCLIINNLHRYISFRSDNPQLCFKYTISDGNDASFRPLVIQQKFVFNLNWSPEDFSENLTSVDELVSSGELEFFNRKEVCYGANFGS